MDKDRANKERRLQAKKFAEQRKAGGIPKPQGVNKFSKNVKPSEKSKKEREAPVLSGDAGGKFSHVE